MQVRAESDDPAEVRRAIEKVVQKDLNLEENISRFGLEDPRLQARMSAARIKHAEEQRKAGELTRVADLNASEAVYRRAFSAASVELGENLMALRCVLEDLATLATHSRTMAAGGVAHGYPADPEGQFKRVARVVEGSAKELTRLSDSYQRVGDSVNLSRRNCDLVVDGFRKHLGGEGSTL